MIDGLQISECSLEKARSIGSHNTFPVRAKYFVATLHGVPVGRAGILPVCGGRWRLIRAWVDREHRRRGICRELVRARIALAVSSGAQSIEVSSRLRGFFESIGFVVEREFKHTWVFMKMPVVREV